MASADSDRFSAIFTQVESLHQQGMDQQLPRGRAFFKISLGDFSVVRTRRTRNMWSTARSMPVLAVCVGLLIS
jgi:hypothetical protein